ncbi:MAG: alpha-ketoacid dehydrogenase subunit beta, partial [Chloroflexi bacterium]
MQEYSYAQALNQGIGEEMRRNEKIMILGEDVGKYGGVFGVTRGL